MNVLVMSASNKVPLIECIKSTCKGLNNLITADSNSNNITRYFSEDFWKTPMLKDLTLQKLINYCYANKISYIVPTRDAELVFFSRFKNSLENKGIYVLVSKEESIEKTLDKLYFTQELDKIGVNTIPTSCSIDFEAKSYVIKERYGAGSKKIYINIDSISLNDVYTQFETPIIQPYINGKEYSIDLYITRNRKVKAAVVRERTLVIYGESQITEVINYPKLAQMISEVALALDLEGHVMFQAIKDMYGKIWIIECNARIGGASTLSIYAGLDTFNWWIAECNGENIDDWPVNIKKLKQVRYKKDLIL